MEATTALMPVVKKFKRSESNMFIRIFGDRGLLELPGGKFAYFIEKNYSLIEKEMKAQQDFNKKQLEKRGELSKEFLDAEKEILEQYCTKDQSGSPIVRDGMYNIPNEKMDEFNEVKKAMIAKNAEFKKEEKKVNRYNSVMDEYMAEEIELKFFPITEHHLPENITASQRIMIKDFII